MGEYTDQDYRLRVVALIVQVLLPRQRIAVGRACRPCEATQLASMREPGGIRPLAKRETHSDFFCALVAGVRGVWGPKEWNKTGCA